MVSYIKFFSKSKDERVRVLSNFAELDVVLGDKHYKSGEHAFQSEKYICAAGLARGDEERKEKLKNHVKKIEACPLAELAKQLGSKSKGMKMTEAECKEWNKSSIYIQFKICESKLKRHECVRELLRDHHTYGMVDGAEPVLFLHQENRGKAPYWGGRIDKKTGELIGKNMLGEIWSRLAVDPTYIYVF